MPSDDLVITPELAEYIRRVTLREPDVLRRLREETASHPYAQMQISAEQGQFMALLINLIGARRVIEIGVFTGYSSLAVALALPEDGRLIACDVSEEWTSIARRYWSQAGVERQLDLRVRPALQTLDDLIALGQAGSFDFAFIDADKANYANYFERVLVLLRPRGLIAVDNVLWSGRVLEESSQDADTRAIQAFNEKLKSDERIWLTMLPIRDGLTLACKKPF